MKRFWQHARAHAVDGGFAILLDARPMRLPGGGSLHLPSRALADAVAAEWDAAGGTVGGEVQVETLALTRLAATASARVAADPAATIAALAKYGESDLLCYRAEHPAALAARQAALWDPWLAWAQSRFGAALRVTSGIMHVRQDDAALAALQRPLHGYDAYQLAALGVAVPAMGSLVLGLAMCEGALDAAEASALSQLDEGFQEEMWGTDAQATAQRAARARDIADAQALIALTRAAPGA